MAASQERTEEVNHFVSYFLCLGGVLSCIDTVRFLQVIAKDIPEVIALLSDLNEKVYLVQLSSQSKLKSRGTCSAFQLLQSTTYTFLTSSSLMQTKE
jgi:hypothetical protein